MKYIKKIILENFQSHKYTEVELDRYLNVIVGPSDQGKTAIIRGLKWALFNEPSGDFFIREGETECSVTIIFNDDMKLKRYRSKTKNAYYLYDNSGEEIVFEGFGTKVPKEIIDKTFIRKIILDSNQSNSINIGEQLEGPFLLSEKNSTRANAIGRLVGVHIIDDSLREALKDSRNLNIKKKNHEESLQNLQKNLSEYKYLDDLIRKAEKLKNIKNEIYNKQIKLDSLSQNFKALKKLYNEINLLKKYLTQLKSLNKVEDIKNKLNKNIKKFYYIYTRYNKLIKLNSNIKNNERLLISLKNNHKVEDITAKLSISYNKVSKLSNIYTKYRYINNKISTNKNTVKDLKQVNKLENSISLIKKDYLRITNMENLKYKLDNINKSLSLGKIYTEKLSNIDSIFDIKDLLESKSNKLKKLIDYRKRYNINKTRICEIKNNLIKTNGKIDTYLKQYEIILNKVEVCPTCFSSINKGRINEIINSYKKEELDI